MSYHAETAYNSISSRIDDNGHKGDAANFVRNVDYTFQLTEHARRNLAFRYRLVITSEEITAYYEGRAKLWTPERNLHKLVLDTGRKILALLKGTKIITVFPSSAVMRSNIAVELIHCIDCSLTVEPDLYTLQEISNLSEIFEESQGNYKVSDLRRDIRSRSKGISSELQRFVNELTLAKSETERLISENDYLRQQLHELKATFTQEIKNTKNSNKDLTEIQKNARVRNLMNPVFGISGTASRVGKTTNNKPIFFFENCEVVELIEAEKNTGDWHQILFTQGTTLRVLSTKYKSYLQTYREGDKGIYTVYMGKKHFVHSRQ